MRKIIISVIATLIIVVIILQFVSIQTLFSALELLSLKAIFIAFLAYLLGYGFRALRFRTLVKISFERIFSIVCVHNFFINILPARIGEGSFLYLLKKEKKSIRLSAGSLIIVRGMDAFFILLVFFIALLLVPTTLPSWIALMIGLILFIILVMVLFFYHSSLHHPIYRFVKRITPSFVDFDKTIKVLHDYSRPKTMSVLLLTTFGILFTHYLMFSILLVDLGVTLTRFELILASFLLLGLNLLPIHGVAGVGTFEGAWILALLPLGISVEVAAASAVAIHAMQILFFAVLGVFGFITLKSELNIFRWPKRPNSRA